MKTLVEKFLRSLCGKSSSQLLDRSSFNASLSYSQSGEDMIVCFILNGLGMSNPIYLDIGAHHPTYISNTALFYGKGCKGINIEPDPTLFKAFEKYRRKDINLNIRIGIQKGILDFYLMSSPSMNTCSKEEAERLVHEHGMRIKLVLPVPVDTILNVTGM